MRNEDLRVDQISLEDPTFDFSMEASFIRDSESESTQGYSSQFARIIVRESNDSYELVYGHRTLRSLLPTDRVHAIVLEDAEASDESCYQTILTCDLTLQAGLLTQYQRACAVRNWGVSERAAARLLGVSAQAVSNWLVGAAQHDELVEASSELPTGLTFSHLVVLARVTEKSPSEVTVGDKISYLGMCSKNQQSVRKFEETLQRKLFPTETPVDPPTETEDDLPTEPREIPDSDPEEFADVRFAIASAIRESAIQGVAIEVTKTGQLNISATAIPVQDLERLAACLSLIRSRLAHHQQAA